MRDGEAPSPDSTTGVVPQVPWRVTSVRVLPGHRVHVRFVDGIEGEVDVSRFIFAESASVFVALRDPAVFAQAYLNYGATCVSSSLSRREDMLPAREPCSTTREVTWPR